MFSASVGDTIRRKIKTFQSSPIKSIKAKSRGVKHAVLTTWAKNKLSQNSVLPTIAEFVSARPKIALLPHYPDLWFLYRTVRTRQPRIILEFGSGCSTVVLSKALFDNRTSSPDSHGYLYSVDADAEWARFTASAIPSVLREFCEVTYSPLLEVDYKGIPAFRHAKVPSIIPNLVYLDGPALTEKRQVAVDILDLEEQLPADFCLIVDGRKENTEFLRKHLKRNFLFKRRRAFNTSVFTWARE